MFEFCSRWHWHLPWLQHSAGARDGVQSAHKVDRRRFKVGPLGVSGPSELFLLSGQGEIRAFGFGETNAFAELSLFVF